MSKIIESQAKHILVSHAQQIKGIGDAQREIIVNDVASKYRFYFSPTDRSDYNEENQKILDAGIQEINNAARNVVLGNEGMRARALSAGSDEPTSYGGERARQNNNSVFGAFEIFGMLVLSFLISLIVANIWLNDTNYNTLETLLFSIPINIPSFLVVYLYFRMRV